MRVRNERMESLPAGNNEHQHDEKQQQAVEGQMNFSGQPCLLDFDLVGMVLTRLGRAIKQMDMCGNGVTLRIALDMLMQREDLYQKDQHRQQQ